MSESLPRRHNAPESEIRKRGTSILSGLSLAVRTAQLYSADHQNFADAIDELEKSLRSLIETERDAEISRINDSLFVNGIRLKVDAAGMKAYDAAFRMLEERGIGCIHFSGVPNQAELRGLVELLAAAPGEGKEPWDAFRERLGKLEFSAIRISKHEAPKEERIQAEDDPRTTAIKLFFGAVEEVRNSLEDARAGRQINLRRLKRIAQLMADSIGRGESTLLSLIQVKEHGSRLANHLVNVAVLSMVLGTRLGLPKKLRGHLGLSALLHDLGWACAPEGLDGEDQSGADESARAALEGHVYRAVELLSRQKPSEALLYATVTAFFHHLRYDGTGYPQLQPAKSQNLCTRIVAIADAYERLTSRRGDGTAGVSCKDAMRKILEGGGTEFDPLAAKAFVGFLGFYPVGSVVRLNSGELATVVAPARDPRNPDRPQVRIFADASGMPADGTLDLAANENQGCGKGILEAYREPGSNLRLEEYLSLV